LVGLLQIPDDPAMLLVLGNALQGQGQTVAAIAQYRIALALRPADPDILNSLGGTSYDRADQRRSVRLEQFRHLVMPEISLVSLQKGAAAQQVAGFPIINWTAELSDMADTAALVGALDLVISVDTAVAHPAGALGQPIWLLNRRDFDWRWLVAGEGSAWYPSLRQFRQPVAGDWATPIGAMAQARQDDNTSRKLQTFGKD
jgi:hypothetical protein